MKLLNKIKTSPAGIFLAFAGWILLFKFFKWALSGNSLKHIDLPFAIICVCLCALLWLLAATFIWVFEWVFGWKIKNKFYNKYLAENPFWQVFLILGDFFAVLPLLYMLVETIAYII